MSSIDIYKHFIDCKFEGIEKLNDSCTNNVSALNKIVRIFKEYYVAQENYSKAISKSNANLAQIANNKSDCFHSIFDAFSTTFCVFTNVQKEFTNSLNQIIKFLVLAIENNEENLMRVLTVNDMNIVTNFKNIQLQLDKNRQKYYSLCSSNNGDPPDKVTKRARDNYEATAIKYNKLREDFFNVMYEVFDRSKQYQFGQLETMRKCVKNVGNALSKLIFDMRESVDSLKNFYRSNSKEDLFKLWVDSNKIVADISVEPFPDAVIDIHDCVPTEQILADINPGITGSPTPVTKTPEIKIIKRFQSRRSTVNLTNGPVSVDQEDSSAFNRDIKATNNKKMDKMATGIIKSSKRRWSGFMSLKKFQSANDLVTASDIKQSIDENCWQSRTNLNESVVVDAEGFIIRDSNTDEVDSISRSSSSNSSHRNTLRGIKVNIKPVNNVMSKTASKSEVIRAALQLPLPRKENLKSLQTRRVSNLQRSTRPVSELDRDKFYRRSASVSELRCVEKTVNSPISPEFKLPNPDSTCIPIASAMTEIISSSDGGYTCSIQGQLVLALPIVIKDLLQSSSVNTLPSVISFELVSHEYEFASAQILKPYQDVARLEQTSVNRYTLIILKELFERISTDQSCITSTNRISFPLLEYSIIVRENMERIVDCHEEWSKVGESCVQFDFNLLSRYLEETKFIKVYIKLLTDGVIQKCSSDGTIITEIDSDRCLTIKCDKYDHRASVRINSDNCPAIRLKLSYEFIFENCSIVMPNLLIKSNKELKTAFKISLMHYRTISTGGFSQLFDFNIL